MNLLISFVKDFLTAPEILVGLIVCIGLIVQKKTLSQIITGTSKTIIGILILFAGAGTVVSTLNYLGPLLQNAFNAQGLVPANEVFVAVAMSKYAGVTAYIIIGGFIVNLLLARFTPMKYIFLAGHHILYAAVLYTIILATFDITGAGAVIIGSLFSGFLFTALPAINQRFMNRITDGQPIAMGHFGATGYWLAGFLGKYVGDPNDSTENIRVPKSLQFIKETVVASTIIIIILFGLCVALIDPGFLTDELNVNKNPIVFVIIQGLTFGAGLTIIIQGVRMMVGEILPAFEGIATKVVPDAIPALDCPVVFPFAPNAVLIGFVSATIAGIATTVIIRMLGGVVVVPPVIQFFFMGGAAGVFGNATGGKKGAILGGIVNGILFTALPPYLFQYTNLMVPGEVTMADPDFCWSGIILGKILSLLR